MRELLRNKTNAQQRFCGNAGICNSKKHFRIFDNQTTNEHHG